MHLFLAVSLTAVAPVFFVVASVEVNGRRCVSSTQHQLSLRECVRCVYIPVVMVTPLSLLDTCACTIPSFIFINMLINC